MRRGNFSKARSRLKSVLDDADYSIIFHRDANAAYLARLIGQYRAGKIGEHGLSND